MTTQNTIDNFPGVVIQSVSIAGGGSNTASTSYVDITNSSISITPTSSTSLILIIMTCSAAIASAAASSMQMRCIRGASTVIGADPLGILTNTLNSSRAGSCVNAVGFVYIDSPATTSTTTYKFQHKAAAATSFTSNLNVVLIELSAAITKQNAIDLSTPGTVVQYQYVNGAGSTTNSASFVDVTNSSVNITPKSTSNKVLLLGYCYNVVPAAAGNTTMSLLMMRNGNIIGGSPYSVIAWRDAGVGSLTRTFSIITYLDSPASTSAVTYKFQHVQTGGVTVETNNLSYILMEIAAVTYSVDYLVVAGGGGGGSDEGGGGGAGGFVTGTVSLTVGTVYTITVGPGGNGGVNPNPGANGSNSVFRGLGLSTQNTIIAVGGGGGAQSGGGSVNGLAGGSGGGGAGGGTGGAGTGGQGNTGGNSAGTPNYPAGGGGGAGAVGSAGTGSQGGKGGDGSSSSITGSPVTYAGGGGGGGASTGTGGAGGSGVVILSVLTVNYSGITTGSPTVTTSGSNTIIKFTADGTYTA